MPWGLNQGSPWKVAPHDFLIAMTHRYPKLLSGAAGAHTSSQWKMHILRVRLKSLKPGPHSGSVILNLGHQYAGKSSWQHFGSVWRKKFRSKKKYYYISTLKKTSLITFTYIFCCIIIQIFWWFCCVKKQVFAPDHTIFFFIFFMKVHILKVRL